MRLVPDRPYPHAVDRTSDHRQIEPSLSARVG